MVLATKLRQVKNALQPWSIRVFGDIFATVKEVEKKVAEAETVYDTEGLDQDLESMQQA